VVFNAVTTKLPSEPSPRFIPNVIFSPLEAVVFENVPLLKSEALFSFSVPARFTLLLFTHTKTGLFVTLEPLDKFKWPQTYWVESRMILSAERSNVKFSVPFSMEKLENEVTLKDI